MKKELIEKGVNKMVELGDLVNHLTDQEWMKQRVLPSLDQSSFRTIYTDVGSTQFNMPNEESTPYRKDPLDEKGLMLGTVELQKPFPPHFEEPGDTTTPTITSDKYPGHHIPHYIYVCLLSDGRIALIQEKRYQFTSRSECAYGEDISGTRKVVAIADNTTITPISNDIANMIVKEIERNAITHRLQERRTHFGPHQWEGGYNHLYDSIRLYSDLKMFLQNDDANTKIFIMKEIVPLVVDLLSEEERSQLSDILKRQLRDDRMCEIPSAGASYADEEDTTTVSSSARYALNELERSGQKTK